MRKTIIGLATLIVVGIGGSKVGAVVDLSSTASFLSDGRYELISGKDLAWTNLGSGKIALIDLKNGEKIQTIKTKYNTYINNFAISDDQKYVALIDDSEIEIYNEFAELVQTIDSINYKEETLNKFYDLKFLPNSHTLIGLANEYKNGKLFGYDLDQGSIIFTRGTDHFGEILISNDKIAVIDSKDAYFYSHDGNYDTVIHPENGEIKAFDFNKDSLLAIGESGSKQLKVYDGKQDFKKLSTPMSFMNESLREFKDIDIDESGQFIATTYDGSSDKFSLFERSGKKIFTTLDRGTHTGNMSSSIELTKDAKKILVRKNYEETLVFDGRNIIKRPVAINISRAHQEVTMGTSEALSLEVTQADGKNVEITEGIKWTTNSPTKAYLKSNQLIGKSVGTYTLKATYEGYTTSVEGKIIAPPKLSFLKDVPWLKRHRQGILTNKSFEGAVAPNASYGKISGVSGKLYVPNTDEVWNGKWKGNILYSRDSLVNRNNTDQIDLIVMLPSLEKRTLTKNEVKEVFGKATKTYTYKNPLTYHVDKSKKIFAKYKVYNASVYHVNGQYLYMAFDKNDHVRFFALSSLNE